MSKEMVFWGTSNGPVDSFALIPKDIKRDPATTSQQARAIIIEGYDIVAPVVIYYYQIYQQVGGTATCLLFFDATAAPADGAALDDSTGFVFAAPISDPGTSPGTAQYVRDLGFPGHRYHQGFVVIGSTTDQQVARASSTLLVSVTYGPYNVG